MNPKVKYGTHATDHDPLAVVVSFLCGIIVVQTQNQETQYSGNLSLTPLNDAYIWTKDLLALTDIYILNSYMICPTRIITN